MTDQILMWHSEKFPNADRWDVYRKLLEEVGELSEAMVREKDENIILEFGDVMICLTVLAFKLNINIEEATTAAHLKNLMKSN